MSQARSELIATLRRALAELEQDEAARVRVFRRRRDDLIRQLHQLESAPASAPLAGESVNPEFSS